MKTNTYNLTTRTVLLTATAFGMLLWLALFIAPQPVPSSIEPTVAGPEEAAQQSVPDFTEYAAGAERKAAFFDYMLPLINTRNEELRILREELLNLRSQQPDLTPTQTQRVSSVARRFRMKNFDPDNSAHWETLLLRVDVVPPSLALAQAANESAWGTSRFATVGNNFFGQWCFETGCGLVPQRRDEGKSHEVARFETPEQSVRSYIHNLNTNSSYRTLRQIRAELRASDDLVNGVALAEGLVRYSERGHEYIDELRSMIRYNNLDELDQQYAGE